MDNNTFTEQSSFLYKILSRNSYNFWSNQHSSNVFFIMMLQKSITVYRFYLKLDIYNIIQKPLPVGVLIKGKKSDLELKTIRHTISIFTALEVHIVCALKLKFRSDRCSVTKKILFSDMCIILMLCFFRVKVQNMNIFVNASLLFF